MNEVIRTLILMRNTRDPVLRGIVRSLLHADIAKARIAGNRRQAC